MYICLVVFKIKLFCSVFEKALRLFIESTAVKASGRCKSPIKDVLIAWERNRAKSDEKDDSRSLENLMTFLKNEVIGEEMIELTVTGFGINRGKNSDLNKVVIPEMPSAAALTLRLGLRKEYAALRLNQELFDIEGTDIAGLIMTGNSVQLSSGVIVLETRLGHTLIGTENLGGSLVSKAEGIEGDLCNNMHAISAQRLVSIQDTNVEKAADASVDPHSISDVPQHRDEIPCSSGVSVDPYSVSDSPIGLQNPAAPPHDTTVTRSARLAKKHQRF
ncbi:hypothetical protein HNY73_011503 [Argiope bruennichi]|uniref:Uncharacterized protein n=1 Tax=Argiope bruennichi TaxID=94029 RepID=A0A8T0F499_ARGBR|nr:hypothetical protein HNY73_011503 [Argiope bruennichi]